MSSRTVTRILPRSRAITVFLVVAFAALTAILAQVRVPLWFTPVPFTGQTLAVLASGLVLGWKRGALSQLLYVAVGAVGFPVFQGGNGGWSYVAGPTLGYLIGFIVAAMVAGWVARSIRSKAAGWIGAIAGTAVVYVFGVAWLGHALGVDLPEAIQLGVVPFLIGDAIKATLAGLLPVR